LIISPLNEGSIFFVKKLIKKFGGKKKLPTFAAALIKLFCSLETVLIRIFLNVIFTFKKVD